MRPVGGNFDKEVGWCAKKPRTAGLGRRNGMAGWKKRDKAVCERKVGLTQQGCLARSF